MMSRTGHMAKPNQTEQPGHATNLDPVAGDWSPPMRNYEFRLIGGRLGKTSVQTRSLTHDRQAVIQAMEDLVQTPESTAVEVWCEGVLVFCRARRAFR